MVKRMNDFLAGLPMMIVAGSGLGNNYNQRTAASLSGCLENDLQPGDQ